MDAQTLSSDEDVKLTKGQIRRAEIISLGRDLLIEEGYDAFVLRTIAARAEITLGNLQYYFPVREDLLEEIVRQEFERSLSTVRQAIAHLGAAETRLTHMVHQLLEDWNQTGGRIYAVTFMLALHQERFRHLHKRHYRHFYQAVADLVRELNPTLSTDDALKRARIVTTLMDGSLFQVAPHGRGSRAERKRFHDELVTTIVVVIAA
ncbi:MAG: TetR/AcrR family transcriptional regulator [Rhodobiaceae bacterium]|nr:TetR/AcrR family transcriptional regulator [Rhodobiaceae bacterium]